MGNTTIFTVEVTPKGQARPRATVRNGYAHMYKVKGDVEHEGIIRSAYSKAAAGVPPYDGPVILHVKAIFEPPKSWSKRKREVAISEESWKTSKPDLTNVVKNIEDALNEVAWRDDACIVSHTNKKVYGGQDMIVIGIERL